MFLALVCLLFSARKEKMRRKEKEITDPAEILDILKTNTLCRIAMIDKQEPYIVPMNYGYWDGILYLHSAVSGRKIDCFEKNQRICFEIDDSIKIIPAATACGYSISYRSLIGYGLVEIVHEKNEKINGLKILMAHITGKDDWEISEKDVEHTAVLKIPIESISGKHN
jgi:nitroimidazol reductase NimA-like FMN-containing flavoprotein (pyridoxamine 5'-phosphate oxidase superfamily)